jgi:catechol 2,3-dioxygenase-like lactoylglutathione lyase family enzyme
MQLKHANLVTPDVIASAEFFQRFFGFEIVDKRGADALAVLRDKNNFVLTLMKSKKSDPDRYPRTFHVGFYFDNPELVNAKHAELLAAGLSPGEVETTQRGGAVSTFYCVCPGGITVEVCTPPGFAKDDAFVTAG